MHLWMKLPSGEGVGEMRESDLMPRTMALFGLLIVGWGFRDRSYMCSCNPSNILVCVIGLNASRDWLCIGLNWGITKWYPPILKLHVLRRILNKKDPFGVKLCSNICPCKLSVPTVTLSENCKLWGTDNVQGQILKYILAPNRGYCVYYPSNIFLQYV